jgi:hypothetical protein
MRKALWLAVGLLAVAAVVTGVAVGDNGSSDNKTFEYTVGLWGDLPYSSTQEAALPTLIGDMNASDIQFSVHDGDLKQGSGSLCDDALYQRALGWFNSFDKPAMFTPGDNDWTDCDRASNGGYSSLERLDHERQVFFSTDQSLGRHTLTQEVQTAKTCLGVAGPTACVENRRWTFKNVVYATLNVQGSCNNLCDTSPDQAEWQARNQADIDWLDQTFAEAKATNASAVMLISQADPGWDANDGQRAPLRNAKTLAETDGQPDGFQSFLVELRKQTIAFGKPVAYVHGDSHYFRIDKPLLDTNGARIQTFTRVETFGDNQATGTDDVQWLKVLVDPSSRDVFAFEPEIVPANAVSYTG